jgi:hypothetical protein
MEIFMNGAHSPMGPRAGTTITMGILFLAATHGCSTAREGVLPEASTPVVTRVQGPGGGDVYLTSELSKGVYHLAASPEEVWTVLPNVFEELGIEINYRNPAARGVGNNQFVARRIGGARNSRYLDCGYGATATPNADAYEVTASLMASVRPGEGGGTLLETLFTASARAREVSGGVITCNSKGVLERKLVEMLTSMMGVPGLGS